MSLLQEISAFLTAIQQENSDFSLSAGDKIVAAVSGGPDSLVLLHLLARGGLHPAENVVAAHLNHQLRPSAVEESQYVVQIAAGWGVECHVGQADVIERASSEGLSLEEAGRKARYHFLAEVAAQTGARFVFTGHHAGDQAETVLMHFLRGSGLAGLRGMLPVSPLPESSERWLVRPLLHTSREEIEAYCQRHALVPLIDESNQDTRFYRNRLRHELLPLLESYNPQIRERLQSTAAILAADYDWLQEQTLAAWQTIYLAGGPGWLRLALAGWQALPLSLRRSTLRQALMQLRPDLRNVGFQTIEQARGVAEEGLVGTQATLPGEITLLVGYEELELRGPDTGGYLPQLPQLVSDGAIPLAVPGQVSLAGGWALTGQWLDGADRQQILDNPDPWTAYLQVDEAETLVVRPRQPGERFQPFGMAGHTKTVKEVMINRKVPAALRAQWPVVAGSHLFWLAGHLIDERVRVRPDSQRILKLQLTQTG